MSDDSGIIEFMALFGHLKKMVQDNPKNLIKQLDNNETLRNLCVEINWLGFFLEQADRSHPELFTKPVNPAFISTWRDYEKRFSSITSHVFLKQMELDDEPYKNQGQLSLADRIRVADEEATEKVESLDSAISFAIEQATDEDRSLPDEFVDGIEMAGDVLQELKNKIGLDLKSVFIRRSVVPFTLIPRHVANDHGNEMISLYTNLKQAHQAYIFGVPYAAIALLRSVLEMVLREHYKIKGNDLNEVINNAFKHSKGAERQTLHGVRKGTLHDLRILANDILHDDCRSDINNPENEQRILMYMFNLRTLIENAPRRTK